MASAPVLELQSRNLPLPQTRPTIGLEQFKYDDAISRAFMTATLVWGIVAFLVGIIVALELVLPQLSMGLSVLAFGRLRPLHTNAAIFAFAGNGLFTAIYYSTQRLCKARMYSDKLSWLHFWGWQLIIVSAAITLPLGITQSKEYAELEWPIDIAIAVVWVVFAINFFATLAVRRERHMYVALWFYIASIVTVAILHIFNNLVIPVTALKSYSIYAGVQDAFMQWWYGHNAVAFFLTTPYLGMMYYFLPKAAERPVFSYRLSIVHFWSLVFIYIWAGPHHLHYTSIPEWASTLGMLFSLMLWMPSWGGMINGLLTLRVSWSRMLSEPVLQCFALGVTFYGMSTFEGPMLSIKSVNALSHYTDWTIAHVHAGALGWNGFMTFGMIYWLLPRLFQTPLYSKKLAQWHVWLAFFGIIFYIVPIYMAGLTQGWTWTHIDDKGQLQHPDFIETIIAVIPLWWIRVFGGTLFLSGALLCAYNFYRTWQSRPAKYEEPIHEAPALARKFTGDPVARSRIPGGVIQIAHTVDKWQQALWHRKWERLPLRFTVWTTIAVAVASLFEIIPTFMIQSNVPTIATVKPYTPLELAGRDIYIANGCYNCHSQQIRPIVAETKRYGEYSKPGEFVYDHPFQWGSRRIGPDLARESIANRTNSWHYLHMTDPRSGGSIRSVMPAYEQLVTTKLDFKSIEGRVNVMTRLGVPYKDEVGHAAELAKLQAHEIAAKIVEELAVDPAKAAAKTEEIADTELTALIAYLQRLGADVSKPPPTDEPAKPVATVKPAPAGTK